MEFERSGGVRGHGMDHTRRFPRTLAGFGLTRLAWGKSIFMFSGNIGNSLHHQIPPNWSSGLQIGPRIFVESQGTISGAIKPINFPTNGPKQKPGTWPNSPNHCCSTKWLPSFCLFFFFFKKCSTTVASHEHSAVAHGNP